MSQFAKDNRVFFEFHPSLCFVKDQVTKAIILKGILSDGLYKFSLHKPPQPSRNKFSSFNSSPEVCSTSLDKHPSAATTSNSSSSIELWHKRLGHCAFDIVERALKSCNIPYNSNKSVFLCQSCCVSKSHKLPYHDSLTQYTSPLQLMIYGVQLP